MTTWKAVLLAIIKAFRIKKRQRDELVLYPVELKTDTDINNFIIANTPLLPKDKIWDVLLADLIREMSEAGWNTTIPIYTKLKYGDYIMSIITDDPKLNIKIHDIIGKYTDLHDGIS